VDVAQGVAAVFPVHQERDSARISSLKLAADGLTILQDEDIGAKDDSATKHKQQR
jgi:hypothetical protein